MSCLWYNEIKYEYFPAEQSKFDSAAGSIWNEKITQKADVVILKNLNLDDVWNNLVMQIGNIVVENENSLEEQIALNEQRNQIAKEITRLDALARKEK